MKKVVRLNERQLTGLIKKVIMENPLGMSGVQKEMCKAEDSKPSSGRPFCIDEGVTSGKLLVMGKIAFIQYNGEGNCPKMCQVANETKITLA